MTEPQPCPVPWTQEQIDACIRELCHLAAKCPGGEGAVLIVALRGVSNFEAAVSAVYDPADKNVARCLLTALERAKERITRDLLGGAVLSSVARDAVRSEPAHVIVDEREKANKERGSRDHEN